jgi:hypothetical protein
VERIARAEFTFLADCPATVQVVLGDARLSMERQGPQGYDLLAVDAFSGDAIPMHLLTREAFAVWFRHLAPGGLLAVHVSNRYLDLAPVVDAAAAAAGRQARLFVDPGDDDLGTTTSDWVLVGGSASPLGRPPLSLYGKEIAPLRGSPWSDDHSDLYRILK